MRVSISKTFSIALAAVTSIALLTSCSPSEGTDTETTKPSETVSASATAQEPGTPSASPSESESPSAEPSVSVQPSTDLEGVTVTDGDTPEITFKSPWAIKETTTKVLKPSKGNQKLTQDSVVTVNYVGVNGSTGKVFDSSYESGSPLTFALGQVLPGFRKGLDGQTVGSRVLIGMPSADGYPEGNADGSIKPGDSLLFVVDIVSANFEEATGEEQPPVEGMPTVSIDAKGVPTAKVDTKAQAPGELKKATLIKGAGTEVTAKSVVQVKYRSWKWADGKEFEDAWAPQTGRLSGLIEGWKKGLVGATAGSRVLLVVPPALAYPEGRTTAPALEPGQTLVYVIDILDVQNS